MNIYEAINRAADSIDNSPQLFNFMNKIPAPECGTPGCALGWIAYHLGGMAFNTQSDQWDYELFHPVLGINSDSEFYNIMRELAGTDWTDSPSLTAKGLRAYADKYYSNENRKLPVGIPDSVRAIFETKEVA